MTTRRYPPHARKHSSTPARTPTKQLQQPRPPAHEPAEREDPLNVALEAAEQLIRNIVASGGEAPLRARLARLLPPGAGEGSR